MPRPRKPTAVLELVGAFKHDPQRRRAREGEPVPTGDVGDAPAHLPEPVATCWREIAALAHPGSLCTADRLVLEHGAQLLARLRASAWQVHPTLLLRWESFLSRMGLTPADRSRVQVALKTRAPSPLDKFKRPIPRA